MSDLGFQLNRYRSKPVEVTMTAPLTTENQQAILRWIDAVGGVAQIPPVGYEVALVVVTTEGEMDAAYGDRIVYGTRGELYPIKPGPFADKYEPAEEPAETEAAEPRPFCTEPVNDRQVCGQYLPCVDHG